MDAETGVSLAENPELSKVPCFNPGVAKLGQGTKGSQTPPLSSQGLYLITLWYRLTGCKTPTYLPCGTVLTGGMHNGLSYSDDCNLPHLIVAGVSRHH